MSFFSFFAENGKHVSDWNVVDSIFKFDPFAVKINPFAFKSIRFLILFLNFLFNKKWNQYSVEEKDAKILAPYHNWTTHY